MMAEKLDGPIEDARNSFLPMSVQKGRTNKNRRSSDSMVDIRRKQFDINLYATKKSAAQGLLDLALLMANASQLKHILLTQDHQFYGVMLALLITSIVMQVAVGVGLLFLAKIHISNHHVQIISADMTDAGAVVANPSMDEEAQRAQEDQYKQEAKFHRADILNNCIVAGIFLLTIVNVFISAFGLTEQPKHRVYDPTVSPKTTTIP